VTLKPTQLGAEPKKLAFLAALLLVAGYFFISNSNSGSSESPAPAPARVTPDLLPAPSSTTSSPRPVTRAGSRGSRSSSTGPREFRPSLKNPDVDPASVDPRLHLGALAKLKETSIEAGSRSLFDIAAAPPPPADVKIKEPEKIVVAKTLMVGPMPPKPVEPPAPPPEPHAPPIPLKFYGFVNPSRGGDKRAFFLDGEDIIVAGEGDVVKKRYKIVRIGVNSAVVQDTEFKSNNEQTLPLVAELAG